MNRSTILAAAVLGLAAALGACGSTATKSGGADTTTAVSTVAADPNIDPQFCALVKKYSADSASFGNSTTADEFKTRLPIVTKELADVAAVAPASVKADVTKAAAAMGHLDAALANVGYDPTKITTSSEVQAATVELSGVDEKQFDAVAKANCGISLTGGGSSSPTGTTPGT